MTPGFQANGFKTYTKDGRNFVLLENVQYVSKNGTVYILPKGATSDGASTPPELWLTIPPFGSYWRAAYLHDCAYRNTLLVQYSPPQVAEIQQIPANLTEDQSNDLLNEAMSLSGTHDVTMWEIYKGVCFGGASSFASDRAAGANSFMVDLTTLS